MAQSWTTGGAGAGHRLSEAADFQLIDTLCPIRTKSRLSSVSAI
jgi:hypothetical protein